MTDPIIEEYKQELMHAEISLAVKDLVERLREYLNWGDDLQTLALKLEHDILDHIKERP